MKFDYEFGEYIRIVNNSGKLICSGRVCSTKRRHSGFNINPPLVSVDNKYFFKIINSKYHIEKSSIKLDYYIDLSDLKVIEWKHWDDSDNTDLDVATDYSLDELDHEVVKLVSSINKLSDTRTTSSCSGHGERFPYIDVEFKTFNSIRLFLNVLDHELVRRNFELHSDQRITNDSDTITMSLACKYKGTEGYKCLDILAELIDSLC